MVPYQKSLNSDIIWFHIKTRKPHKFLIEPGNDYIAAFHGNQVSIYNVLSFSAGEYLLLN